MPSLHFNYEVNPINVIYNRKEKKNIYHFIVQVLYNFLCKIKLNKLKLCAIVGGVFAILGILNLIYLKISSLFKK
jgi:hypothetical protein